MWTLNSGIIPNKNYYYITHGFGYTKILNFNDNMRQELEIFIPKSISIIPASAFSGCEMLTSVMLEEGETNIEGFVPRTIEGYAFSDCPSLMPYNLYATVMYLFSIVNLIIYDYIIFSGAKIRIKKSLTTFAGL
mgnify:CR=1 FL=1